MKNVIINGVTYQNVPSIQIPLASDPEQKATFTDTSNATLYSGDQMLSGATAYSNGTLYTGTITEKSSSDLTASGATVTVPAGYYPSNASKSVASGSASFPAFLTASGSDVGISASNNKLQLSCTFHDSPDVTAGYISSGTVSDMAVSLEHSCTVIDGRTYTPTTSNQTISSNTYIKTAVTISGDANLRSEYIANGVSIFGVTGSLSSPVISQDSTTKVLSIS